MSAIKQRSALAQLEGENEKEKIELTVLKTAEGFPSLEVRLLRWGQGLGWYPQKTILLAPNQARELAFLLRRSAALDRTRGGGRKILPFQRNRSK